MLGVTLIMLGAGDSNRLGLPTKKQWLRVNDEPLWLYATKKISSNFSFKNVIVVSQECEYMSKFYPDYQFVQGGRTRQESLKNALIETKTRYVMTSDVARPNIPKTLIKRLIQAAAAKKGDCIVPVLDVCDSVTYNNSYIRRDRVNLIQTPQVSRTLTLRRALVTNEIFNDDSAAIEAFGGDIYYIKGDEAAKKITYKNDLLNMDLPAPANEILVGNGFDVHRFKDGDFITLGGVKIPHNKAILAHSDGDAAIHALCDALLGAAGLGDIGKFFPDTNIKYKNADSNIFLTEIVKLIKKVGFDIVNVDITIITESPRLARYKNKMQANIAKILGIPPVKVGIKATTTENLGFLGRKEGIAALASASLKYFDWRSVL